ncbi:hypothetical protein J7K56_04490 [Candidatus Calescamantes bacterium]|nr:hypothetical protein [Candidatus Calescamantes bacterium]
MNLKSEKGIIGILALFLMFALVLFGLAVSIGVKGYYQTVTIKGREINALYLAEAGAERAIWKLCRDPSSQKAGVLFENESLDKGTYSVYITELENVDGDTIVTFVSQGVSKGKRKLKYRVWLHSVTPSELFRTYALFWGNSDRSGSFSLLNSVAVHRLGDAPGNVFAYGDIYIGPSCEVVPGLVYSTGTISGEGNYTPGICPDPPPPYPTLDTSYYDDKIHDAEVNGDPDLIVDGTTYNLAGATKKVKGKVIVRNGGKIIGPGRIISTEGISVINFSQIQNVNEIISGWEIHVSNSSQIKCDPSYIPSGEFTVVFSSRGIGVANSSIVEGQLIAVERIEIINSSVLRGVVYLGENGSCAIYNSVQIQGCVFSDEFQLEKIYDSVHIVHDKQWIPPFPPPGVTIPPLTKAKVLSYQELPLH